MRLKMKNRYQRYNINRYRPRREHKYTKDKMLSQYNDGHMH